MRKIYFLVVLVFCTHFLSAQIPNYVPSNGLIGWYAFNGNANDGSGNGYNGTVSGPVLTTDRFGISNKAYSFNGVADKITLPSISPSIIQNEFSTSIWINNMDNTDHQSIYLRQGANYSKTWILKMDGNNELRVYNENSYYSYYIHPTSLYNGWYHLCVTINGNSIQYYVNGVPVHYETINYPLTWTSDLQLLGYSGNTGNQPYPFLGKLDDIGIWNRCLDSCEVKDLYNSNIGVCCGSFITSQPLSQSVNINTTAQFTATSNSPGSTYQWQTDLGVGFQNLNSVSQYSGTGTSTLSISNVTMGNNNQPFRCIITSPSCVDTSNVAVLTVINNAGVNEELTSNIVIYPNPSNDKLTVSVDETIIGKEYSIIDQVGKLVSKGSLINANTTLSLYGLSNGIYTLQIDGKGRKTFVIQKQ